MYHALIRTHHITSRKKVAALKAAAKKYECAVLLRSGGVPGIFYVQCRQADHIKTWIGTVHDLRYKDYQLVAPPELVPESAPIKDAKNDAVDYDFVELETVKELGAKMEEKGVLDWWRKAMGYTA